MGAPGALGEQGQERDERHHCHVLKQEDGEGTLPVFMLQLPAILEDLQGNRGR